jgi:hypothetical protein
MRRWAVAGLVIALGMRAHAEPIPRSDRSAIASATTRASLSPDGPWLPVASRDGWRIEVHDTGGPRVQLVERGHGVELLLYADRATLHDVALDGAELRPGAGHGPRGEHDPGFTLEPGTPLDQVAPATEQRLKVKLQLDPLAHSMRLTGYVAAGAVGKIYLDSEPDEYKPFDHQVSLPIAFQLRGAPGGQVFAVAANRERVDATLLDRVKGWVLVRTERGVVGWIAASQVRDAEIPMTSMGDMRFGHLFGRSAPEPGTLPIGTPLHDAVDGREVGAVAAGFDYDPVQQDGEWQRFDIPTTYGKVALWAHATAAPSKPKPPPLRGLVDISRPLTGALGGRSVAGIRAVVASQLSLIRACYRKQLKETPDLAGDLVMKLSIARDGKVTQAAADTARTTLASEPVIQCVAATRHRLEFAAARAPAELSYAMAFSNPTEP